MTPLRLLLPLVLIVASVAGCGKKGPPRAPLRILPSPPRALSVRQIGPDVVVSALLPSTRSDGAPVDRDAQVRVLRLRATPALAPGAVSDRYLLRLFERQAEVVATLAGEALLRAAPDGRLVYRHPVPGGAGGARGRYLFSVAIVAGDGRRAPLPLPLPIETAAPPPPPAELRAGTAEGEVRLAWAPAAEASALYNVYRQDESTAADPESPLNRAPLAEPAFVDSTFRYGESYRYFVRRVQEGGPPLRESANGVAVRLTPVDRFAPAPPEGLSVAAEGGVIRIYWFPNSEPDLAGYRLYRGERAPEEAPEPAGPAPGAAAPPGVLLGQTGPEETSFTDATAVPGVRYYYAVSAVDGASPPNESRRSEARSEALPADAALPAAPPAPLAEEKR